MSAPVRTAAFAGRWYPASASDLASALDDCLGDHPRAVPGVSALVSPHAGLIYSGPVAGHGYASVAGRPFDVVVLVGPSHYAAFAGVAVDPSTTYATPLGTLRSDGALASRFSARSPFITPDARVHAREHSLEMQLPFLARVLPSVPIVLLLMGDQRRAAVDALARVLAEELRGRRALLVASSDLSHFHPRPSAAALDGVVVRHLSTFDADGLQDALEQHDGHACGGGPMVAVMRAAQALGARGGRVLCYGDSGNVSGDTDQVVGYVSAAFGEFHDGDVASA